MRPLRTVPESRGRVRGPARDRAPRPARLRALPAALLLALAPVLLPLSVLLPAGPAAADDGDGGFTLRDPRITESSGLAASRAHPGVYWTHNDQDGPRVFAVDGRTGRTVATVTLRGIGTPRDMEAISVGPDGDVYVGDIGDNRNGSWPHVWIYRFPEPRELRDQTVNATQFTVVYADGPRNAEALMVHPKTGRVYIASKNEDGGGLYEGPERLSTGGKNVFRRIGEVPWVTDGAFSPDGTELVLRSYFSARAYAWKDGRPGAEKPVPAPFQRQSESVTYTPDGSAYLFGSEGAGSGVTAVEREGRREGDGTAPGASGAPSASASGPSGSSAGGGDGGGTGKGSATIGALVLAGAAAVWFTTRRRRRQG
ncbi:WD40 repeat domain-containing protein [Streptomyces sp. LP05-1]|uniref:WD40 repeat domain-containing protein n=1 Tax=Streptomyces pyxinae TaxID=2970734 RepID=A0ABT2CEX0_9ACTN|nr:WD40 repeat domain-containing protein [Streptomyces sp. LP05-1]MCS0635945.1 WD40 repeat domain-containing protein [Streptomyces sp. LP05-1]